MSSHILNSFSTYVMGKSMSQNCLNCIFQKYKTAPQYEVLKFKDKQRNLESQEVPDHSWEMVAHSF